MLTTEISINDAIGLTLSSMLIVFLVLVILMGLVYLLKYVPEAEKLNKKYNKKNKKKYINFDDMEEDMKVAVLVATIACKKDLQSDVVLKSVRKI